MERCIRWGHGGRGVVLDWHEDAAQTGLFQAMPVQAALEQRILKYIFECEIIWCSDSKNFVWLCNYRELQLMRYP